MKNEITVAIKYLPHFISENGIIIDVNYSFINLTGYAVEDFLGIHVTEL